MYQLFAQTDYSELETTTLESYSSEPLTTGDVTGGLEGGALAAVVIISLILGVLTIAGMWKVFQKAGKPGWAAIVPIYNGWLYYEIAGKPGWWILISLAAGIPVLGLFILPVVIVLSIFAAIEISKRFGKGIGMTLLQIFFPFVAYPILGFGDAKYTVLPGSTPGSVPVSGGAAGVQANQGVSPATPPSAPAAPSADKPADTPDQKPPQSPNNLVQ